MKQLAIASLILLSALANSVAVAGEPVEIEDAKRAALYYAAQQWQTVEVIEGQAFLNPKTGESEIFVFVVQIDGRSKADPDEIRDFVTQKYDVLASLRQEFEGGPLEEIPDGLVARIVQQQRERFAAERFATVAIGANTDQPPLIYLRAGLPEHIARAGEMESAAIERLNGATVADVEFLYAGPLAQIYRYRGASGRFVYLTQDLSDIELSDNEAGTAEGKRIPTAAELGLHATQWNELLALESVRSMDTSTKVGGLPTLKRAANTVAGVPDYDQSLYGVNTCGPTAVAQVMGYWDGHEYAPSGEGPFRNLVDGGPADEGSNLAGVSAMVDQLKEALDWSTNGVWYPNVTDGILSFANHADYQNNLSFSIPGGIDMYPSWGTVQSEIDAGRPFLYEIRGSFEYASGSSGNIYHFVTAVGYQDGFGDDEDMQVLITHFNWGLDTPIYINFGNIWMWDNLWPIVPAGEDTEDPQCFVTGPGVQESYSGNVVVNVSAGDESGIAAYEWQYLAPPNPEWQPVTRPAPWFEGAGILDTVEEGLGLDPHESQYIRVRARAQDNWDRWCDWVELDRDLLIDNTTPSVDPPSITITEPFNHLYSYECFILWEDEDEDSNAETHFYFDTDSSGYNGHLINFDPVYEDGNDSYVWDTTEVAEGIYWIWAEISDGTTSARAYSPGYVEIRHEREWNAFEFVEYEFETADGDIYPETGEEVAMRVRIRNTEDSGIYDVQAIVTSPDIQIVMLDGEHSFGSFEADQSKRSSAFDWVSKEDFAGDANFSMQLTFEDGSGMPYYQEISLPEVEVFYGQVGPAFRVVQESTVYEDNGRNCDGDGILESGERDVVYKLRLENYGTAPASGIEVEVLRVAPTGVDLGDVTVDYPDLNAGQASYALAADDLDVDIARSLAGPVDLEMVVTYNDGLTANVPFKLDVVAVPWIDLDDEFINFGQVPPGLISTTTTVRNNGTAPLTISDYGQDPASIEVSPALPLIIEPQQSAELTISYDGSGDLGAWAGMLAFTSDSHQNDLLEFPLSVMFAYPPSPYGEFQIAALLDNDDGGQAFGDNPGGVVAGNFDLDSNLEIAVVTGAYFSSDVYYPSAMIVWDWTGSAWERVYIDTTPGRVFDIKNLVAADIDGDGRDEIAVAASANSDAGVTHGGVYVYDYSSGSYLIATTIRSNTGYKDGLTAGDRDRDGNLELVFFEKDDYNASTYARVYEFERTSGMNFTQRWVSPDIMEFNDPDDPVNYVAGLTIADSDGDGTNEILFMATSGILRAYEGDTHTLILSLNADNSGFDDWWDADDRCDLVVGDSDDDDLPEIVLVSEDSDRLYVIESTGNNSYNLESPFIVEGLENRNVVLLDDLNENGTLEIITLGDNRNTTANIEIFENFADNSYVRAYSSSTEVMNDEILDAAIVDILTEKGTTRELVLGWEDSSIPILSLEDPGVDLAFVGDQISVSGTQIEGNTLTLAVPVVNLGGEEAEDVVVRALSGDPVEVVDEETISSLPAGQSVTVEMEWAPVEAGSYTPCIVVDPENDFAEVDESNNQICGTAEVIDDDDDGPVITLVSIRDSGDSVDPIESDEAINFLYTVEDPAGVCSVTGSIDGSAAQPMSLVDGRWELDIPSQAVGDHTILVQATDCDNSAAASEKSDTFSVSPAENCPIVENPVDLDPFEEDTSNSTIDISTVFSDPDGDELQYRVESSDHISARLEGATVTLSPDANWFGTETVTLLAIDEPVLSVAATDGADERRGELPNLAIGQGAMVDVAGSLLSPTAGSCEVAHEVEVEVTPENDVPAFIGGLADPCPCGINGECYEYSFNVWPLVHDVDNSDSELTAWIDPNQIPNEDQTYDADTGEMTVYLPYGFASDPDLIIFVSDPDGPAISRYLSCSVVANSLRTFDLMAESGRVILDWDYSAASGNVEFQVEAGLDGTVWQVPHQSLGGGRYSCVDESNHLVSGGLVHYSLRYSEAGERWIEIASRDIDVPAMTLETRLIGVAPNPFNPKTTVSFSLSAAQRARINVFDLQGRRVRCLLDEVLGAGLHDVKWTGLDDVGRQVGSGVYFIHMATETRVETKRAILIK